MEKISDRLYSWASIIDEQTLAQAKLTSTMPFIYPHIALMPDAHLGKGATVGSVIPCEGAVMPAAVGVDIGCGMIAVRTQFTTDDIATQNLDRSILRKDIERAIPLSAGNYNRTISESAARRISDLETAAANAEFNPEQYAGHWRHMLGSLGSGNHFIEVSADEDNRVWLFLHSGSRGVGNKLALHHIEVAQGLMKEFHVKLPDRDLAYLPEDTPEFSRYLAELHWAQAFAFQNRAEMMDRVIASFERWIDAKISTELAVNCHHNYTAREKHYSREVIISRKGAIDAHAGVWGLIPGSMGDKSYVVTGKGFAPSLSSAPHGAGRFYSRSVARKKFTQNELRNWMNERDIEYRDTSAFIDEYPLAYKQIDTVMHDAADLVNIEYTLRQLVNVKGD